MVNHRRTSPKYLQRLRANDSTLTTLAFSYPGPNHAAAVALGEALQSNTTLTTLRFDEGWCVRDAMGFALGTALKTNTALTTLSFFCSVSDAASVAVGEALKSNAALTTLNISTLDEQTTPHTRQRCF